METIVTWLLEDQPEEEEHQADRLKAAIESIGDRHITISRHEARYGTAETRSLHDCPTLAYGSIEFAKAIRSEFYPGKWCDWTALRCERYYPKVGAFLLNDDYILLPVGEVLRRQKTLLAERNAIFLRPVRADKSFSGFVAHAETPAEIEAKLRSAEAHDLVVLAEPKEIEAEYRAVAMRGTGIVTASQYMRNGQLTITPEMPAEARQVAAQVMKALGDDFPDPMFMVDIARSNSAYRLLELNSFSASDFYACDLEVIARAAHDSALREWEELRV